jgi:hypothetical protein
VLGLCHRKLTYRTDDRAMDWLEKFLEDLFDLFGVIQN